MARTILKLSSEGQDWYMEWSSIVDAPLTFGMSLEDFKEYYLEEYGKNSLHTFDERMARVEKFGTSSIHKETVQDFVKFNRAGKKGTILTLDQIIEFYCRSQNELLVPEGTTLDSGENATE